MAEIQLYKTDSAYDIAKKYGLDELSKARTIARKLYINGLVKRISHVFNKTLSYHSLADALDDTPLYLQQYRRSYLPELPSVYDYDLGYSFGNDLNVLSRRGVPLVNARMLYDRKVAEAEAARREARTRTDRIISRYLNNWKEHSFLPLVAPENTTEEDLDNLIMQQMEEEDKEEAVNEIIAEADTTQSELAVDGANVPESSANKPKRLRLRHEPYSIPNAVAVTSKLLKPRPVKA